MSALFRYPLMLISFLALPPTAIAGGCRCGIQAGCAIYGRVGYRYRGDDDEISFDDWSCREIL